MSKYRLRIWGAGNKGFQEPQPVEQSPLLYDEVVEAVEGVPVWWERARARGNKVLASALTVSHGPLHDPELGGAGYFGPDDRPVSLFGIKLPDEWRQRHDGLRAAWEPVA